MSQTVISGPQLRALFIIVLFGLTLPVMAEGRIPHVDKAALENYAEYQSAETHRAFAIAPGGAWSWRSGEISAEAARQAAIEACREHTEQQCIAYAINDQVVFDTDKWKRLWGPYPDHQTAQSVPTGVKVGRRLPNLAFKDATGKSMTLGDLSGKVVLVHFWGSWCPPCMREFPTLNALHKKLKTELKQDVAMVLLQVREPIVTSRDWAKRNGFSDLPLYDSGSSEGDEELRLRDGSTLPDRLFARVFPSSYVIDRNGIIRFAHRGPISDWLEYLPFFQDAAQNTQR